MTQQMHEGKRDKDRWSKLNPAQNLLEKLYFGLLQIIFSNPLLILFRHNYQFIKNTIVFINSLVNTAKISWKSNPPRWLGFSTLFSIFTVVKMFIKRQVTYLPYISWYYSNVKCGLIQDYKTICKDSLSHALLFSS